MRAGIDSLFKEEALLIKGNKVGRELSLEKDGKKQYQCVKQDKTR